MSGKTTFTSSVMEGKGAYNNYAKLQAGGAGLAMPLLKTAIQNVKIDTAGRLVVVDYGSSQGKNSLAPMQHAIETFGAA